MATTDGPRCGRQSQTSQPGNRPGREKLTPRSMHIHFLQN